MGSAELYISGPSLQTQAASLWRNQGVKVMFFPSMPPILSFEIKKKFKTWSVVWACLSLLSLWRYHKELLSSSCR